MHSCLESTRDCYQNYIFETRRPQSDPQGVARLHDGEDVAACSTLCKQVSEGCDVLHWKVPVRIRRVCVAEIVSDIALRPPVHVRNQDGYHLFHSIG